MKQGSTEWHAARIGRVTSSRVAAVLGCSPLMSRNGLMRSMILDALGLSNDRDNYPKRYGRENEKNAIRWYEVETGNIVMPGGFHICREWDRLGASPDGLIGDNGKIEVKCPWTQIIKPISESPHYWHQVQCQYACTDRDWSDFVVWTPDQSAMESVEKDHGWKDTNFPEFKKFIDEYDEIMSSPELQKKVIESVAIERDDEQWFDAAMYYRKALYEKRKSEQKLAYAKELLVQAANDRATKGHGVHLFKVNRKESIDYKKAAIEAGVDLKAYKKEQIDTYWSVRSDIEDR